MSARFVAGKKVWQIERIGTTLHITEGKAKPTTRKFVTVEAAEAMLQQLVAERERAGYVRDDPPPPPPPEPKPEPELVLETEPSFPRSIELELAIAEDPYNPGPYLVYADWLQARGDPRGELIVTMANGLDPSALLKTHKRSLFGALAGRITPRVDQPPLIWKYGFIHRIELERERHGKDIAPLLDTILGHPSGAVVAEATLRSDEPADLRAAFATLIRHPPPLRALEIVSRSPIGDLAPLLAAFPRLARLTVKIRSRRRVSPGIEPITLRSVATGAPAAALERLELRIGTGDATAADLAPLFVRELPRLTHLRIRDARFGDALVGAILAAPFAAQLVVLDLGMCELADPAARQLAAGIAQLPSLAELWLTRDRVSRPAVAVLEAAAPRIVNLPREPVDATFEAISKARFGRGWE